MIPDYFIDPVLLCSQYHLTLNHSLSDYLKYYKLYSKKVQRNLKYFKNETLIQENLYQTNNLFLMISGQKTDYGKIIFCSKSIEKVLGGDSRLYIGTQISSLFPPSFQSHISRSFKTATDSGDKSGLLNTVTKGYICHKEGHLIEVDYFVSIHPFLTQGFYYVMVIRHVPISRDFLLICENGDIERASLKATRKLGLNSLNNPGQELVNVKVLSKELGDVNTAFNMYAVVEEPESALQLQRKSERGSEREATKNYNLIAKDTSKSTGNRSTFSKRNETMNDDMTLDRATDLYNLYKTRGKEILLKPYKKKEELLGAKEARGDRKSVV